MTQSGEGDLLETRLLETGEVAEILHVSTYTVRQWARDGVLPGVIRVGRRFLIPADKLADWMEAGGTDQRAS